MDINLLLRENIKNFKAYSSARDEYSGSEGVFLDANENAMGSVHTQELNRYPDPYQWELKDKIAQLKKSHPKNIFLGNGSDEAIDLLFRAFCTPGTDQVMLMPPTYGMYGVCADLNDIGIVSVSLTSTFEIDRQAVLEKLNPNLKMIFICSPNNPTANVFDRNAVHSILKSFAGLVVIDEAYADFSESESWISELANYQNLVILQTFSKAWGMANARLGMAFANEQIVRVLNSIKYPYNVNGLTQQVALKAIENESSKTKMVSEILCQRKVLTDKLMSVSIVKHIFPSQANFLLVRFSDAKKVFRGLLDKQIIVRDRSSMPGCENCLRITVGTARENELLIDTLKTMDT